MAFKVFISHSMENMGLVEQAKEMLEQKGLEAYVAVSNPQPGKRIDEKIIEHIKSSKYFLLLYTKEAAKSQWVHTEIGMAVNMKKTIIPIIEEGVEVPPLLQGIEYIKMDTINVENCINAVCDYLIKIKASKDEQKIILAMVLIFIAVLLIVALAAEG